MGLAIVTGASRGIGKSLALRLAERGHTVACLARSEEELRALAAIRPGLLPVPVDLVDRAATERVVRDLLATHGACEVLVNNAGYGLRGAIEEISLERWKRQFELNLFAVAHLSQLVLPGMRAAGRGAIVNVSSVAGRISTPFSGAYAATKFALEAMSDAMRIEVARHGVRVILVEPGPVSTDFAEVAQAESAELLARTDSPYRTGYERLAASLRELHQNAWTADDVALATMRALDARRSPQRVACYGATLRVGLLLTTFAPRLFDRVLAHRTGA